MSGERGTVRKIFDIAPTSISSSGSYDGSGSPTTAWATGIYAGAWLTPIAQSVNDNGRVGISVAVETLDLRLQITPDNATTGHQHIRLILFADNECDGALPAITDLLGDTNGAATQVSNGIAMAFLQPAYLGRFQIIEDKNWYYYSSVAGGNLMVETQRTPTTFFHESHHDLRGHRVMWDTTDSSAIANARKGHIFAYLIFENKTTAAGGLITVTTANPPAISWNARLRYRDE